VRHAATKGRPAMLLEKLARYFLLMIIWTGAMMLAISLVVLSGNAEIDSSVVMVALGGLTAAVFATYGITPRLSGESTAAPQLDAKRKNDQTGGLDPLALLSPDDLEDLRAEVKQRLRERLLTGADGEVSSLDALLNEAQAKRR
jgi:hypothetical protein